jgi:2,3-bisphosphoglycerate-independent phosphoglycerate mutase
MPEFGMKTIPLKYLTMTQYSSSFKNVELVFPKFNVDMTLGELIESKGGSQLRIAETEKYPHVTFFFSGGRESEFNGEERLMVHSPKVATYDMQPEMSAYLVTDALEKELNKQKFDFICLNYANGDMVGHTGDYNAIINACEAVDKCLSRTVETAKQNGYSVLIIADHGNAEMVLNPDNTINTAHTVGKVPIVYVGTKFESIQNGILADVAPTLCKIMGIEIPEQMTGKVLL